MTTPSPQKNIYQYHVEALKKLKEITHIYNGRARKKLNIRDARNIATKGRK